MLSRVSSFGGNVRKYFVLFFEINGVKSKIGLLTHIPKLVPRQGDVDNSGDLIFDTYVKNQNGILFCGKNFTAVHTAASFHEKPVQDFIKKSLTPSSTFIDIGANIGKYTIIAGRSISKSKGSGKVIAIEPESYNYSALLKNISLNNLNNVIPVNCACFSSNKNLKFYVERSGSGFNSIYKKANFNEVVVKGFMLDTILAKHKIKKVDLIKLDVEGAEIEVLKGAKNVLKHSHPMIVFECWENKELSEITKILNRFGYQTSLLYGVNYIAK